MRFVIFLWLSFVSVALFAQADSVRLSATLISYSALHAGPPDFSPDTLLITYDRRGNETQKILISPIRESTLGVPIIHRSNYDSLNRLIKMEAFAFNLDTKLPVTLKDTASATMDTMLVWFDYQGDTCQIETTEYTSHLFGAKSVDKYKHCTYFDTLGREVYAYELDDHDLKINEKRIEYTDRLTITHHLPKQRGDKTNKGRIDTLFKDDHGIAINRKFYDDGDGLKYYPFSKCGNCEHIYFKKDSSQIYRELWQDYEGTKMKEIFYEYQDDKVVLKTERLFKNIKHQDSIRTAQYAYDSLGNVIFSEHKKRNRVSNWKKVLIRYQARNEGDKTSKN